MFHAKSSGEQSDPDTSIEFGNFTPDEAPILPSTFSPTKIDPFGNTPVLEEGGADDYSSALDVKPSAISTTPHPEPTFESSILGDEGTPDDLLLQFSQEFLSPDPPPEHARNANVDTASRAFAPPPNANVATTSRVATRTLSSAVLQCLKNAYRQYVLVPTCGYKYIPSTVMGSTRFREYTAHEQSLLYGTLGVIKEHCPLYRRRAERRKPLANLVEPLFQYECRCPNCPFAMKVARVPGGLAILQRCTKVGSDLVPLKHNEDAHDAPTKNTTGRRAGAMSFLSFKQKELILNEADKFQSTDALSSMLLLTKKVEATRYQKDNPAKFKKAVQQFKDRNRKFFANAPPDQMTVDVLLEILDLLRTPPHRRTDEAPVGASDSPYYKTEGWTMYLWRFMWLHSHDYNAETGQFTYIIFFPIDVFARAKAFAKTFDGVQL